MAASFNPIEPTPTNEPELKSLRVYSNDDPSGSTVYKVAGEGGSSSFDLSDRMKKGSATGAVIEGYILENKALGTYSHTEGKGTTASGRSEHVFGEYNVSSDPESPYVRSDYVEIVGNGESAAARSNARTLDWSGNESLSGSLTLGMGTANETTLTAGDLRALLSLLSNS